MGSSASVPITEEKKHKIREHFKHEVSCAIEEFDFYNRGYLILSIKDIIYYNKTLCITNPEILKILKQIICKPFTFSIHTSYDRIMMNLNVVN
jgi:hypothetical protein